MKILSLYIGLICGHIFAKEVNIIAPFCPLDWPGSLKSIRTSHNITDTCPYHSDFSKISINYSQFDKVLFFDQHFKFSAPAYFSNKNVLFNLEPYFYDEEFFTGFSRVYTWNDLLVDNKKFFKIYYPYLCKMENDLPSFKDKKFICMVASHWVEHRLSAVSYFSGKNGILDVYGRNLPMPFANFDLYKGPIPGHHSGTEKINVLKQYRFNLCFENSLNAYGYITEKIFACFQAGCVPVYWGAANIDSFIPADCFIDIRKFHNFDELTTYLINLSESEYDRYLQNIRAFLASENAKVFSIENFETCFEEAIIN